MSRTFKDRSRRCRWFVRLRGNNSPAMFKARVSRRRRVHERVSLARGVEPDPRITAETEYYD